MEAAVMGEEAARAGRVLFEDVKPYDAPARLADLAGPAVGVLHLSITVYWGPPRVFDLSHPGHVRSAYQAIVRDGRVVDQVALVNAELLVKVWPTLLLPVRVRGLWEDRFPELAAAR